MVKCNIIQQRIACAQIKRICFICHGNITTGEVISLDNQSKFLVRTDYHRHLQGTYTILLFIHKSEYDSILYFLLYIVCIL